MTNIARIRSLPAVVLAVLLTACGGDGTGPPEPVGDLVLTAAGRAERGGTVTFTATRDGAPAAAVTWTAEPAAAVQWIGAGEARLLSTGTVRVTAAAADASGSLQLAVTAPPSVVFERIVEGQRDIWRMALDGADLARVSQHAAEDAWPSASQGSVYYVSYRVAPAAVFSTPAAGGADTRVTTVSGEYAEASVSPDGSKLAFIRTVNGVGRLFISDRNGSNPRRVVASGGATIEAAPGWSPDGSRVVFVSTLTGNADIYTAPAAGGEAVLLAQSPAADVEPSFSTDGRSVVFVRSNDNGTSLFTVDVTTRQERQLTDRPGVEARPVWLPDGRIVFTITESGVRRLHWLDLQAPAVIHLVSPDVRIEGRPSLLR